MILCSDQPDDQTLDGENFEGGVSCSEWGTREDVTDKQEWSARRNLLQVPFSKLKHCMYLHYLASTCHYIITSSVARIIIVIMRDIEHVLLLM